jgi:hypothetical protein
MLPSDPKVAGILATALLDLMAGGLSEADACAAMAEFADRQPGRREAIPERYAASVYEPIPSGAMRIAGPPLAVADTDGEDD